MKVLLRNSKRKRIGHWSLLISTTMLFFTGLTWYVPWLARLIGGYQVTMIVHRIAAAVFILTPVTMTVLNRKSFVDIMKELTHWTKADTKWMMMFPLYVLRNDKTKMPLTQGKFNSGQKLNGSMTFGLCAILAAVGLVWIIFPNASPQLMTYIGWSHRLAALFLLIMLGGHAFLGSGLYKPYRGMARTMFADGYISEKIAQKIWPSWAAEYMEKDIEEIELKQNSRSSNARRA